jgi:hypothetical protein
MKISKDYYRYINRLANSELTQSDITQQTTNDINSIKITAQVLLEKSGKELVESMQAVTDALC